MKILQHRNKIEQRGAVSLFVVIFSALLITTVTISFMQLMVRDQRQAMYSDLSESAYDSAMAGVEDAKRALLRQRECIGNTSAECEDVRTAIRDGECSTLTQLAGVLGTEVVDDETRVMQSTGDSLLEQAYTCVKIATETEDYLGSFESANTMTLIPLRGVGSFDRVVLSWSQSEAGGAIDLPSDSSLELPRVGAAHWPQNRPALLRAQLINGSGHNSFQLSSLDASSYSNTLFLYPSLVGSDSLSFNLDGRREGAPNVPWPVNCEEIVASGAYACTVELVTMAPVPAGSQISFLALAAFYNPTDYRVELRNGDTVVPFDGVQPEVDATGRANDLFRRVISRVEMGNTFNYPVTALETSGNLCKDFSVTTEASDYISDCTP